MDISPSTFYFVDNFLVVASSTADRMEQIRNIMGKRSIVAIKLEYSLSLKLTLFKKPRST